MEQRAIRWEALMLNMEEIMDLWAKVQKTFLYLEPIFASNDIIQTLEKEWN